MEAPQIGQTIEVETERGTKVFVEVTMVEENATGWTVWGYSTGRSTLKARRASLYPNAYYVDKV